MRVSRGFGLKSWRAEVVQILLPDPYADKRFVQLAGERLYDGLLDRGVGIWNFQPSMLHAKIMTVDGLVANIGSANLNSRSVALDEEVNLVALDRQLTAVLDEQYDADLERSVRIQRGRWRTRPLRQRLAERAVGPAKHWL